jgi:predicted lipoprotein with Yx(FWY)xxD motif
MRVEATVRSDIDAFISQADSFSERAGARGDNELRETPDLSRLAHHRLRWDMTLSRGKKGVRVMKKTITVTVAAMIFLFGAPSLFAQMPAPAKVADTAKGKALVDAHGMTLYTFDRDNALGKSNCNGKCAANWPPFAAPADAAGMGNWTVIVRNDGSKQWAYKGKPLYRWMDDKEPGDVDGDRRNNVWHVATP